jgi:hypothetical protein
MHRQHRQQAALHSPAKLNRPITRQLDRAEDPDPPPAPLPIHLSSVTLARLPVQGSKVSPLTEPSRHNAPSRLPGGSRSIGTAGINIGDQDNAGRLPGE